MRTRSLQRGWRGDGLTPYRIGALGMAGLLVVCWFARGPDHPVYGLLTASWTLVLGPVLAAPVMLRLPDRWFHVRAGEHRLHRALGVGAFAWLLDRSGWNRHVALPMRGFTGARAALRALDLSVRGALSAHGAGFALHLALAALALVTGHPWGAAWILLAGAIVHLYPALLQRAILLRLQPMLERSATAA